MDFLSMEPVTIPCSELIPGYHKLKGEGSHNISFDKLLVISCRHTDFTFLIPCIKELNAKDVIVMGNANSSTAGRLTESILSPE